MGFLLRDLVAEVPPEVADKLIPQCPTGKTGFRTKAYARREVLRINRQLRLNMKVFRCHYCEQYHLGHPRGRRD